MSDKPYSVVYFDQHPDETNEALTGHDFATLQEAEAFLATDPLASDSYYGECTRYVIIDGPDLPDIIIRDNPHYVPERPDYWRREFAMQQGMMHGTAGYNEAMGYDGYGEPF